MSLTVVLFAKPNFSNYFLSENCITAALRKHAPAAARGDQSYKISIAAENNCKIFLHRRRLATFFIYKRCPRTELDHTNLALKIQKMVAEKSAKKMLSSQGFIPCKISTQIENVYHFYRNSQTAASNSWNFLNPWKSCEKLHEKSKCSKDAMFAWVRKNFINTKFFWMVTWFIIIFRGAHDLTIEGNQRANSTRRLFAFNWRNHRRGYVKGFG